MAHRRVLLGVGVLLITAAVHATWGVTTYTVQPLGDYPGTQPWGTSYTAINNAGEMIGTALLPTLVNGQQYYDTIVAFRTEPYQTVVAGADEIYSPADTGSGIAASAMAINDSGQVVGGDPSGFYVTPANGSLHSVRVSSAFHDPVAISNTGEIVAGNTIYTPDGSGVYTTRSLGAGPPSGHAPMGAAINSAGQVAGSVYLGGAGEPAFVTSPGAALNLSTDLIGTLGGPSSSAVSINAAGVVAGDADTSVFVGGGEAPPSYFSHAMYYDGNLHDLGTLGGDRSLATAINDADQIVGSSQPSSGGAEGFVYEDGTMYDLNTLVSDENWKITNAEDINNDGVILVSEESLDGSLMNRNALLVPTGETVPEPKSLSLLVAAAAGLVARRQEREINR